MIDFQKNGYTIVKSAIDIEKINFIKNYFIFTEIRHPNFTDTQVPNAYSKYADPMTENILITIKNIIEEKTHLSLFPTYSYYRIYRSGDVLLPHKDRESCEISATLCLGYSYNDNEYQWPINIEKDSYHLFPGDLAIYRGIECAHWRNKFNPPNEKDFQIQTFLHYVDKNGPYAEWKNDKRIGIGYPKVW